MSETKLCEVCKASVLSGDMHVAIIHEHHGTSDSFQRALKMGCELCIRLRATCFARQGYKEDDRVPITIESTSVYLSGSSAHAPDVPITFDVRVSRCDPIDDTEDFRDIVEITLLFRTLKDNLTRISSPIPRNTGDEHTREYLKHQLDTCLALHHTCAALSPSSVCLPTRLIDVGTVDEPLLRVMESSALLGIVPNSVLFPSHDSGLSLRSYAVLSHCWGGLQPIALTQSSAQRLFTGVSADELPLTFQHAVAFTRGLGMGYLWIDSLCIYQDDLADWQREAERMRDVYRNSTLCIAATAAHNGHEGLMYDWHQQSDFVVESTQDDSLNQDTELRLKPGTYLCSIHPALAPDAIDSAPLNRRAWVAQERYLSRRILHFTRQGVFWECHESFTCETHPDLQASCCTPRESGTKLKQLAHGMRHHHGPHEDIYEAWVRFRNFYTKCGVTKETDVLIALQGVGLDVCELLDDKLVFGLWQERLFEELNWFTENWRDFKSRPSSWRAPSWSWASSTRHISHYLFDKDTDRTRLADILRYPKETNDAKDWQLHSITIQGRLMSVSVDVNFTGSIPRTGAATFNDTVTYRQNEIVIDLDGPGTYDKSSRNRWPCEFLALDFWGRSASLYLEGLLIVRDQRHTGAYTRIGHLWLMDIPTTERASVLLEIHSTLPDQEILLI